MIRPMFMNLSRIVPVSFISNIPDVTIQTPIIDNMPTKILMVPLFFITR